MPKAKKIPATEEIDTSVRFTEEHYEQLNQIVLFLMGMRDAFDVKEVGHPVEMLSVHGLVTPAYEQANAFLNDFCGRMFGSKREGAA